MTPKELHEALDVLLELEPGHRADEQEIHFKAIRSVTTR